MPYLQEIILLIEVSEQHKTNYYFQELLTKEKCILEK